MGPPWLHDQNDTRRDEVLPKGFSSSKSERTRPPPPQNVPIFDESRHLCPPRIVLFSNFACRDAMNGIGNIMTDVFMKRMG